jgi:hypothetical protein
MHFYGMSVEELYRLPIRTFWAIESNVGRLMAEQDLRMVRLLVTAQAPKSAEETARVLAQEMGTVVIEKPVRDEAGFSRLKNIAQVTK